jgi:hypothetical protein
MQQTKNFSKLWVEATERIQTRLSFVNNVKSEFSYIKID